MSQRRSIHEIWNGSRYYGAAASTSDIVFDVIVLAILAAFVVSLNVAATVGWQRHERLVGVCRAMCESAPTTTSGVAAIDLTQDNFCICMHGELAVVSKSGLHR